MEKEKTIAFGRDIGKTPLVKENWEVIKREMGEKLVSQ